MTAESPASPVVLRCPRCQMYPLPEATVPGGPIDCPACRSILRFGILPPFYKPPETVSTASGETALDGESVCFFHSEKRAAAACDRCGRYMCALCDVPFGGRHLCPSCLDTAKMPELTKRRFIGPYAAFLIGVGPIVLFPIFFFLWVILPFTGLAAIVMALWTWNKPPSLVHGKRRWMSVAALLGGFLQLAGVWAFVYFIFIAVRNGN